ncbi:MAG: single-stranded DNA-binding protein [Atopobiaceae bacterium]|nr:single-stranded DNA-binding protein [Atopobiaceae bacterium]
MSINVVSISGNLTRDAELKVTQGGTPVLSGSVAVNERVKQGDQWTDKPNFVDWVLFGPRAEKIAGYLTKGTKVAITGRLSYSSWTDKQTNQKRSKLEVVVTEIEFFRPSNVVMDAPTAQQAVQQVPQQPYPQQPLPNMPQQTYQQQMNAYYQQ